jgi:hypothetical protein
MGKFLHNVWTCLNPLLVAILLLVCYQHRCGDKILLQMHTDLQAEHDALVSRLSSVLPGAAYIEEPVFNKDSFTEEISAELNR